MDLVTLRTLMKDLVKDADRLAEELRIPLKLADQIVGNTVEQVERAIDPTWNPWRTS